MTLRSSTNASMRAWRRYFPLVSVESVTDLLQDMLQIEQIKKGIRNAPRRSTHLESEPNLAFISIILGYIEHKLAMGCESDVSCPFKTKQPILSRQPSLSINTRKRPTMDKVSRSKRANMRSSSPHIFDIDSPSSILSIDSVSSSIENRSMDTYPLNITVHKELSVTNQTPERNTSLTTVFPILRFEEVEALYQEFHSMIVNNSQLSAFVKITNASESNKNARNTTKQVSKLPNASRELIRLVCNILCAHLASSRQREHMAHTQSVYSFLKNGLLDSFGLALTTVAACQLLGYFDVHLSLSEDHAWVEFGPDDNRETADVAVMPTLELQIDKIPNSEIPTTVSSYPLTTANLGYPSSNSSTPPVYFSQLSPPPVRVGYLKNSWLFLNGFPVVCKPTILSVAAAITAIQPCGLSKSVQSTNSRTQSELLLLPMPSSGGRTRRVSGVGGKRSRIRRSSDHRSSSNPIDGIFCSKHSSTPQTETISIHLVNLKKSLLWIAYRAGMLSNYPLGLTNLADIEEGYPSLSVTVSDLGDWPFNCTRSRTPTSQPYLHVVDDIIKLEEINREFESTKSRFIALHEKPSSSNKLQDSVPLELLYRSVDDNRAYFNNQHVYPYIYLGNYLFRHGDQLEALHYWAEAARVIGQYNYCSEDAEIYRQFLDIATRIMPEIFKSVAIENRTCCEGPIVDDPVNGVYQPDNLLDSSQCLAYLLSFYDHLCLWEESSVVPVLHVGWVDKLMVNLTRFSPFARRNLHLEATRMNSTKTDTFVGRSTCRTLPVQPCSETNQPDSGISSPVTRIDQPSVETSSHKLDQKTLDIEYAFENNRRLSTPLVVETGDEPMLVMHTNKQLDKKNPTNDQNLNVILPSSDIFDNLTCQINQINSIASSTSSSVNSMVTGSFSSQPIVEDQCKCQLSCDEEINLYRNESVCVYSKENKTSPFSDIKTGKCSIENKLKEDEKANRHDSMSVEDIIATADISKENLISFLASACDRRLLNPAFLLGKGYMSTVPFLTDSEFANLDYSKWYSDVNVLSNDQLSESCEPSVPEANQLNSMEETVTEQAVTNPLVFSDSQLSLIGLSPDNLSTINDEASDLTENCSNVKAVNIVGSSKTTPPSSSSLIDEAEAERHLAIDVVNTDDAKPTLTENSTIEKCSGKKDSIDENTNLINLILDDQSPFINSSFQKSENLSSEDNLLPDYKSFSNLTPSKTYIVHLRLLSMKMSSIVELLQVSGRLNSSAIKLALTAQSQVCIRSRSSTVSGASAPLPTWKPPLTSRSGDISLSHRKSMAPATR